MEEGTIFDDLQMDKMIKSEQFQSEETITITKTNLKGLIDNLKIKHRAEMDAILIEQMSYKRIIKQMMTKLKAF